MKSIKKVLALRWRSLITTVIGTLLLGAAGSGLWDILFKPGLGKIGRVILYLITFGSKTLKNYAYESAALDPTPLASLVLILLLVSFVPLPLFFIGFKIGKWRVERKIEKLIRKAGRKLDYVMITMLLILVLITLTASLILNQAVLISRVFRADLTICGPYISADQEKSLKSKFASMKTKVDYSLINKELNKIADEAKIKLIEIEPW